MRFTGEGARTLRLPWRGLRAERRRRPPGLATHQPGLVGGQFMGARRSARRLALFGLGAHSSSRVRAGALVVSPMYQAIGHGKDLVHGAVEGGLVGLGRRGEGR